MTRRPPVRAFLHVLVAVSILTSCNRKSHVRDPNHLLAEADRLALLLNWPKAEPLYAQAETLFNQSADKKDALYARLGWIWSKADTGGADKFEGEVDDDIQNALVRGDRRLMLRALVAKAAIQREANEASAQDAWEKILVLANTLHDQRWRARAEAELGEIAFLNGDVDKATRLVKSALISLYEHADLGAALYYSSIVGNGLVEVGQPEKGLEYCNTVLKMAAITKDIGFPYMAYEGKARALVALHREAEAEQALDVAVKEARAQGARAAEAQLLVVLGKQAAVRDRAQAIKYLRTAVDLCQENGFRHVYAWSAIELANVYRDQGDLNDAEIYGKLAIEAMQEVEDKYHLPSHLALLADLEVQKNNLVGADHLYSQAEDVAEGMLIGAPSREVEASLIAAMSGVYLGHFELAFRLHNTREAFQILETARGRSIADSLEGHHELPIANDPMTATAVKEVNRLQSVLLHATTREERTSLLDRLFEAEQRLTPTGEPRTLLQKVALHPAPAKLEAVQRSLHPDETVLEYVVGQSRSYCLYLTRTAVGVSALADGKTQAESLVRQYRNEINRKNDSIAAGRALYEFLIKPLPREALKHRLIIVPDGDLHLLPFDSLVDDKGEYLVASHIVTVAPSASVLYLIRTSTPVSQPSLTFLGVGDVQYQQGPLMAERTSGDSSAPNNIFDLAGDPLPNLPMTRNEIMEAAGIFGQKSVELLGADATEASFKAEPLDQFRIIHIATHAIASATFPDRSALVLGEDSKKQEDGLLQSREIRRLHLNADLVTLSACDTGAGRLRGEEGIASLERSFLFAGARSVLATLWTASDAYTRSLVEHFYRHLAAGEDEGAALREAKLDLIKEFRSEAVPYYWAGFYLVGDASGPIPSLGR